MGAARLVKANREYLLVRRLGTSMGARAVTARRTALSLVFLVSAAFYLWTATTGGQGLQFGGAQGDYYNQQTNGFLAGHLYLPTLPPKGLLDLANPYNPSLNAPYRPQFLDLSLYHGHFYLPWGFSPVFTLFLPWRILHVGGMPQNLALFIYCVVGLAFSLMLLALLVRSYLPKARTWLVVLAAVVLATGNIAPFNLRSVQVYEVAESCSYCFAMIGLYLFARGGLGGRFDRRLIALGSLSFGIAAGGHVDAIFLGIIPLGLSIAVLRRERPASIAAAARRVAPAIVPFAVLVLAILAFNEVRFGSIMQYGQSYQLAGGWDQQIQPVNQPGYIAPNLYYFVVAPPRFDLIFPYFSLPPPPNYPGALPGSYIGLEITGGVVATTPILLSLFALPVLARRRRFPRDVTAAMVLTAAAGTLVVLFLSLALWGATMRYEANFAPLLLIPAVLCWLALCQSRPLVRRTAQVLGSLAIVFGALVGIAISISGYANQLANAEPGQFAALRSATSPLATLFTMMVGHPVVLYVSPTSGATFGNVSYLELGGAESTSLNLGTTTIDLQLVSPHGGTWSFNFDAVPTSGAPRLASGTEIVVQHGHTTLTEAFRPGAEHVAVPLNGGLNDVLLTIKLAKGVSDNGGNPIYTGTGFTVGASR